MKLSFLAALPIVLATVLVGCAGSDNNDEAGITEGAASATAPITIQNYLTHPKIKAIRDQVNAIDHLALTKGTNPGCDGTNEKYTDAQGRIRKLVSEGGEGGSAGRLTVYYNEQDQAIFAFSQQADYTGEKTPTAGGTLLSDARIYFDPATTQALFQAVRTKVIDDATSKDWTFDNIIDTADRLPTGDEKVASSQSYSSPEKWFSETGCAGSK